MFALQIFGMLVWFATAVWIFHDAEDNFGTGLFWVLMSILFFPIGPLAYLVMRSIAMRPAPPSQRVINPEFKDYTIRGSFATKHDDKPQQQKLTDPEVEKLIAAGNFSEAAKLVAEKQRELESGGFDWRRQSMYKDYELLLREKQGAWD